MEKINKYDPFSDEVEYSFYTNLLDIKEKVNSDVLEKIITKSKEENLNTGDSDNQLDTSGNILD
jgi:hypothetical protein